MAIDITSLVIQDEFGNDVTDFSLCNIQDKLTITYAVTVSEYAISDVDNAFVINYTPNMIGSNWLYDPRGQFASFKIGDTIERKDYTANTLLDTTTILDKLDNFHIQLATNLSLPLNTVANTSIWNIKTPITAINYYWNFIENSEGANYASKVDGSIQKLSVNGITTASASTPMDFQGLKTYQIGSASIVGSGINTTTIYGQKFTITHNTFFTPFFLSDQWTDLVTGINAPYYTNTNCLKHIFKIEALYNYTDPNRMLTYISEQDINLNFQGNTGGYNENFNTGLTNYSIDSVVYTGPLATVTPEIELTTDETTFAIVCKNILDTPFSNTNTEFTLQFIRLPYDESEYQNNGQTIAENFTFDRLHATVGGSSTNGDTFGTDWQILKGVTATFNSSSQITINGTFAFDANVLNEISASNEYRYLFSLSVQDHTRTNLDSDRVNLIIDINTFYVNSTDTEMVVINNTFLTHQYSDFDTESTPEIEPAFDEDEIVAQSRFYIDTLTRELDEIVITSVEAKIKAKNSVTNDEFTLDRYSVNMANLPLMGGYQYIDLSVPRVFHIPTTEIRKNVMVKRRTDLDASGKVYFDVTFPFMVRWEYWLALANVNSDFFDLAEPNNGFNNYWNSYEGGGALINWDCYYEIIVNATKNGVPQQYSIEDMFTIDYAKGTNILTYDSANVELTNISAGKKYILGYEDTKVVATFDSMPSGFVLSDCAVEIGIEVFEQGGIIGKRMFSSVNIRTSDTWFKTSNVSGLVDLTIFDATTLKATCLIDYNLIPTNLKYSMTARLYYKGDNAEFLLAEDGTPLTTELGLFITIE